MADLFVSAQRSHGGSGISKAEADGLKRDLEAIRRLAQERQAKLDDLQKQRESTADNWLKVVRPRCMTFIEQARSLRDSASAPEMAEQVREAKARLAQADQRLTEGSDWLIMQCEKGFSDSSQALTLYGNLSTLINQARAEIASVRAGIDLREEQEKSIASLAGLNQSLLELQARSDANESAQSEIISRLNRSLEAGQQRQQQLEAQSAAADQARAAQHEETLRATAQMRQTMDDMAATQMAARAALRSRSTVRRADGQSRSVSLRGPALRRAPVSAVAREMASQLVDALPASLLVRAASAPVSEAEICQVIAIAGQKATAADAAGLLAPFLREQEAQPDSWAEPRCMAQQVIANLSALVTQSTQAMPVAGPAPHEIWVLQMRRNMTCGETPVGRSIDRCLVALRRAETVVEAEVEGTVSEEDSVGLGLHQAGHRSRAFNAAR